MKSFFEGIASLFVDFLFVPFDGLRKLELSNWWAANTLNWIFILICCGAMVYWIKQLNIFKANNEDEQDTTAHSFLK
ncbi:uracil phosphoribosyltransferase [Flavobacterium sp. 316]|uniref:Uracil phosphoribosyltransferase n=1 Tax=Flavobacterium sediminilitoris TaxID=2024526 RepID=A0ABY4HPY8_9FLAO|nr:MULTISPECIES: hypothetical protein [Flavobacterium]KIX20483.1 uracil phosphoribosyltransferase [Flavobacterium sp. 316]UOX34947.1 uracil phosphoribosyltransferase [Flavobacterium sediminilitoris]